MRSAPHRLVAAVAALSLAAACGDKHAPGPQPQPQPLTSAWQDFSPGQFVGGELIVQVPSLGSDERLAVLLVNAGGDDRSITTVGTVGTGDPSFSVAPLSPSAALAADPGAGSPVAGADVTVDRSGVMAGQALVSSRREETMARLRDGRLQIATPGSGPVAPLAAAAATAALPTTKYFCQGQLTSTGAFQQLWKSATLAYQTPQGHAAFYYTDEVKPGIDRALLSRPDFFTALGDAYESKILPKLNTYFGAESDVDQNGLVIFLFGNLGRTSGNGFVVGYFWPGDIVLPQASALTCPNDTTGNRADMLYLLDPGNFTANWAGRGTYDYVLGLILDGEYPSTMAHELQHDVNFTAHGCVTNPYGCLDEELWLNEGLSMLSETVAGYGLHTATSRANVRNYQGNAATGLPNYQGYGMTIWEGDPYGNYAGVQAYMQYLLDHACPYVAGSPDLTCQGAVIKSLENKVLAGKANIEAATGVAWETGFARFTTAAMFSSEDSSFYGGGLITSEGNLLADPAYNYLGDGVLTDYVPWHHYTGSCTVGVVTHDKARTAYVAWTPITTSATATLRRDGWAAFATGPGANGPALIGVWSTASVSPHVVVVKYKGFLPNYSFDTSCP